MPMQTHLVGKVMAFCCRFAMNLQNINATLLSRKGMLKHLLIMKQ